MALVYALGVNLGGVGQPQRVEALSVTAQLVSMLGLKVQLGRAFTDAEDLPGQNRVVLISDGLWRRSFGADPTVVGRSVVWNRTPVEIVGVLARDFRFPRTEEMGANFRLPNEVEMIRPLGADLSRLGHVFRFGALVKLKKNASADIAAAELSRSMQDPSRGATRQKRVRLLSLKEAMVEKVRQPLWLLFGVAGVLFAIVCINLGNLFLVRDAGRQLDWAVRWALGAGPLKIVRQTLTESSVLALVGTALGVGLAYCGLDLMPVLAPSILPRLDEIAFDWRVFPAALFFCAGASCLCSLPLVWRRLRSDPQSALQGGSHKSTGTLRERRAQHILLGCQACLSVALAAVAGLLIVSFSQIVAVDKGFNPDHVLTFQLSLEGQYAGDKRTQLHSEILDTLRTLPGVASAGLTSHLPLEGESWVTQLRRPGEERDSGLRPQANYRFISPGYFETMGTSMRKGRMFEDADRGRKVAILSERAARTLFTSENPVGSSIQQGDGASDVLEVVGVVADVKTTELDAEASLTVYLPFWQLGLGGASYVVRASVNTVGLVASVRTAVGNVARDLPIHRVRTMNEMVDVSMGSRRLQTYLAAAFASAGLLLMCLGVFGVVSHAVARRTREIGVRVALGAAQYEVVKMVAKDSLLSVLVGIVAGVGIVLGFGQFLTSQLYGVTAHDFTVLGTIAALVCVVTLAAAYWPALRAAKIEPMRALRWE